MNVIFLGNVSTTRTVYLKCVHILGWYPELLVIIVLI